MAAIAAAPEVVRLLVRLAPLDTFHQRTLDGATALFIAVSAGKSQETVAILGRAAASAAARKDHDAPNVLEIRNDQGVSPMEAAISNGYTNFAQTLVACGAHPLVGPRIWAGLEVATSVLPLQKGAIWDRRAEAKSQVHDGVK